jgi:hypothetical protein
MGKLLLLGLISACLLTGCGGGGAIGGGGNGGGGGSQPPVLASLQISPTNPSVAAGLTQKFTATGKFSDGSTRDMTASVTWASSSPSVATINVSGTPGLAKGVAPGSTTISATSGGVSGTTTLAVGNALLTSIAVTPGNATIPLGVQQQFTAIGTFTDGTSLQLTSNVLWSSSNNIVLSISASGLGVSGAVGAVTVTATSAGMSGSSAANIGPAQLVSIAVTTATPKLAAGASATFTATGTFTDATTQDLTATATWGSSAPLIAPVPVQGVTQTQMAGTSTITATASGISGSTLLTVTKSVAQSGTHIRLRANINPNPGLDNYSDVVGEARTINGVPRMFAYLASWHHTSGVQIIDMSNPDAPTLASVYAPAGTSDNMQGVQVANGIGFFASDSGGGVHIVDLTDPTNPIMITRILPTSVGRFSDSIHDITIDSTGHLLFIPGYPNDNTIEVWDVSTRATPALLTIFNGTDALIHDVTVSNNGGHNRLYASGWNGTSDIFDISNPQSPQKLGTFTSGFHTQDVSVSTDGNFLFCPHELGSNGDVAIFDISNPAAPVQVNDLQETQLGLLATSPSTSKLMRDQLNNRDFLYVAWYQAGLAVFDVTDPANAVLVGNYDTWPGVSTGGSGGGNGDWGIWPFLGTDKVLIGDRTTGLYIVDTRAVSSQPAVFSLTLTPNPVSTGSTTTVTGTVFLVGVAPTGGTNVTITTNNAGAPGQTFTISAGAHSATFTQTVPVVSSNTTVNVTASDSVFQISTPLSLKP